MENICRLIFILKTPKNYQKSLNTNIYEKVKTSLVKCIFAS